MPTSETLTVALEGPDISLSSFVSAVTALDALVKDLSAEVAPGSKLVWEVDDLQMGSAIATIRGRTVSGDPEGVARVSAAYETIGEALTGGTAIPYSERVGADVAALTAVLDDHVQAVRLETAKRDYTIAAKWARPSPVVPTARPLISLGAVEGRVQTLSNRGSLRFTLYDTLDDRAIACYLKPGEEDRIQMLWGRRVIVEGEIRRDPWSGRPTAIRQITDVVPLPERGPDDWQAAKGALAEVWNGEPAEETIRRIRDAW
jgi:hypothetical protein